jgi:hypothetical protein
MNVARIRQHVIFFMGWGDFAAMGVPIFYAPSCLFFAQSFKLRHSSGGI